MLKNNANEGDTWSPRFFMTDNDEKEIQAVETVFEGEYESEFYYTTSLTRPNINEESDNCT